MGWNSNDHLALKSRHEGRHPARGPISSPNLPTPPPERSAMGIPRGTARLLLDEHRQRPFSGTVLQLGRSTIYFTWRELEDWARRHGVELAPIGEVRLSHDPRLAKQGCIDDRTFFGALGFERVESCDISEWEGAEHIFDLNLPAPAELDGRFDVIVDPGSSLQVFHQPNLLDNMFRLLRPGGRVIHAGMPSNNHVDLGFYMHSPTFCHDFYSANGWRIESEYFCILDTYWHRGRLFSAPWKVYRYTPGCLDHLNYGRFGGAQAAIFMVATKTEEATGDRIPQLGQYVRSWQTFEEMHDTVELAAGQMPEPPGGGLGRLQRLADRVLNTVPLLDRLYRPVKRLREKVRRLLPRRRMPPLVARY